LKPKHYPRRVPLTGKSKGKIVKSREEMARPNHYSPTVSRFVVSVLYHEAKARKIPMTKLTDQLLRQSLEGTEGWKTAESARIAEDPPPEHP
jgi:hypothetical protein